MFNVLFKMKILTILLKKHEKLDTELSPWFTITCPLK